MLAERVKQTRSRNPVLNLYTELPGHLTLLTMPGPYWTFEKQLLYNRNAFGHGTTEVVAVESDPWIYSESLDHAPVSGWEIHSENEMRTGHVVYLFGTVEKLIDRGELDKYNLDGAWLDFSGVMDMRRLEAIYALWPTLSHSLVVTFLGHRYREEVRKALRRRGESWQRLFGDLLSLPPQRVEKTWYSYHHVGIRTTFVQLTIRK